MLHTRTHSASLPLLSDALSGQIVEEGEGFTSLNVSPLTTHFALIMHCCCIYCSCCCCCCCTSPVPGTGTSSFSRSPTYNIARSSARFNPPPSIIKIKCARGLVIYFYNGNSLTHSARNRILYTAGVCVLKRIRIPRRIAREQKRVYFLSTMADVRNCSLLTVPIVHDAIGPREKVGGATQHN